MGHGGGTNFPPSRETTWDKAADEAESEATAQSLPTGPQRTLLPKETPAQLPGLPRWPGRPGPWQHLPDCAWCPTEDIQALPARLANGNSRQTGDPSSQQEMGSVPYGTIDPAIDGTSAEPSLASTRQLPQPRQHHQQASARKAAATAQTCNPAVRSLFWRRHAAIGKRRSGPKRSCETQPIPAPVCEINVRPLTPWHSRAASTTVQINAAIHCSAIFLIAFFD